MGNPRTSAYGTLLTLIVLWLSVTMVKRLRSKALPSRPRTPDPEKPHYARQNSGLKPKFAMETPGAYSLGPFILQTTHSLCLP